MEAMFFIFKALKIFFPKQQYSFLCSSWEAAKIFCAFLVFYNKKMEKNEKEAGKNSNKEKSVTL